jgi:anti-sigma-K factor RskA
MSRSSDDIHLLAGAYALDALDEDERSRFEQHLPGCETCRHDLEGFTEATGVLALAVAEPPPPSLRGRVLDEIQRTRQVSRLDRRGRRRWRPTPATLLAAAAVVVALACAALALDARRDVDRLEDEVALAELAQAPDLTSVELSGGPGATWFTYATSRDEGVLVGHGLAPAPARRTYQLWLISGGVPRPAGVFDPDDEGRVRLAVPEAPRPGDRLAVTVEPTGGSLLPTSDPVRASEPI